MVSDGYWDMNVCMNDGDDAQQAKYVETADKLGYSGVVFTHTIIKRVIQQTDVSPLKPIADTRVQQRSRLLYYLYDSKSCQPMNATNACLKTYDILSVRPLNESVFHHACKQMQIDIISLDLSQRLPFNIKKVHVNMALARGVHFEICYAPMLTDRTARRHVISNALHLIDMTRGRNIIISSAATTPMHMRSPHDAQNLALLFRVNISLVKPMFTTAVWNIAMHALARNTEKMVMRVEECHDDDGNDDEKMVDV